MSAPSSGGIRNQREKAQSSQSPDRFLTVLSSSGPLYQENVMADVIAEIVASQYLDSEDKWNLEICAQVLSGQVGGMPPLDWTKVVSEWDGCKIVHTDDAFRLLTRFFRGISGNRLPIAGLLRRIWKNKESQLFLLKCAANCFKEDIDLVDFSSALSAGDNYQIESAEIPPNRSWMCVAFYHTLFDLAESGLASDVRKVLMDAAERYPEHVTIALARSKARPSQGGQRGMGLGLREEVLMRLAQGFSGLAGSRPTSDIVMTHIGEVNQSLLVWLLRNSFKRCTSLGEVQKTMATASLNPEVHRRVEAEGQPDELLGLWCVMCDLKLHTIDLGQKLAGVLSRQPGFARPFAVFLRNHAPSMREAGATSGGVLSYANFDVILELLQRYPAQVSSDEVLELSLFSRQAKLKAAEQAGQGGANTTTSRFGMPEAGSSGTVSARAAPLDTVEAEAKSTRAAPLDTVEAEANDHYMRLYRGQVTVAATIQLLSRFKGSKVQREQEVFRCMLHNLFDEFRFYHNYPEQELILTANLFGGLVANQLVSSITLGIALRYVLEALRVDCNESGTPSKMFQFGKTTLEQFRARLGEWPQYCTHLLQISQLKKHAPVLHEDASIAIHNPGALSARVSSHPVESVISTTATVAAAATPPPMTGTSAPAAATTTTSSATVPQPARRSRTPLSFEGLSIERVNVMGAASHGGSSADDIFNLNMDPMLDCLVPLTLPPPGLPLLVRREASTLFY